MSLGRILFNEILPEDYPLVNEPVNQKKLTDIIEDISLKYDPSIATKTVGKLQQDFFKIGTLSPSTFNVGVFIPPDEWLQKKKQFEKVAIKYSPAKFQEEATKLTEELVKHIENSGYRIHNILKGGIKGNPVDDWKNLLVGKGYIIDIEGNLLGPVVHGISEGLNKQEYFDSIAEARRGFYYKASLTAIPGYLARKLTMSSANISLSDKDCGTKTYYQIYVSDDNIKALTGRFMLEGNKLVETNLKNLEPYINKTIKLRSPLYCMAKKNQICPICFGTLAKKLDTKRIGILASGVINLITINQLMKMRHRTSQINATHVDFPKIIKESNLGNINMLDKLITIEKNKIFAKKQVKIEIDKSDYHESELVETSEYYFIPGIITISDSNNLNHNFTFPFSFQVKLFKPSDFDNNNRVLEFNYQADDKIIEQEYIIDQTDPSIIRKLFDAGYKYLNSPELLTEMIYKRMPSDMTYIETIVQNMFRSKSNNQNNCRLTHYKNCEIFSQKQLPFLNSWVNSISFENIDKSIKKGLLSEGDIRYDPIEKIVIEKFI